jgi:hypothetical protein
LSVLLLLGSWSRRSEIDETVRLYKLRFSDYIIIYTVFQHLKIECVGAIVCNVAVELQVLYVQKLQTCVDSWRWIEKFLLYIYYDTF